MSKFHKIVYAAGALTLAAGILAPSVVRAAKNQPATITFRDAAGDEFKSDGLGSYNQGSSGASVFFVANGNVTLDLTSSTRTVYLDFSTPDTNLNQSLGLNPVPAAYTGYYHAYVTQGVLNSNGTCCTSEGLLGMTTGEVAQSFLSVQFTDPAGQACQLNFAKGVGGYAQTTDATVVKNADGTWTLTTFANDVGELICSAKKNSATVEGYFNMPGQYTVAKN